MKRKNRDIASDQPVIPELDVKNITPWPFKSKEPLNTGFVNVTKEMIFFNLPLDTFVMIAHYLTALEFSHFFLLHKSITKQINPIAKLYFKDKIKLAGTFTRKDSHAIANGILHS